MLKDSFESPGGVVLEAFKFKAIYNAVARGSLGSVRGFLVFSLWG